MLTACLQAHSVLKDDQTTDQSTPAMLLLLLLLLLRKQLPLTLNTSCAHTGLTKA
jgi:hypothetical protein